MKKKTIFYVCTNCDHEFELNLEYSDYAPAQVYGPPENCYPEEGGEVYILNSDCTKCNAPVDEDKAAQQLWEILDDDYGEYD